MRQCCGPGTLGVPSSPSDNLPPVLGEEAGDGGAKAAEGDTQPLLNLTTSGTVSEDVGCSGGAPGQERLQTHH